VPLFCNDTKLNLVSAESFGFYAAIYFTRDYDKLQYVYDKTGLSEQAMQGMLTPGYYLERNLMAAMKKVKKVYNSTICASSVGFFCSNRELAYAQWLQNSVSASPPKPLNATTNLVALTGVHHYKPELKTFFDRQVETTPNVTLAEAWDLLSSGQLFNQKFIGDVLLEKPSKGNVQPFNIPTFKKYLKMLMIEEGLGGLFVEKTVQEYIEGYTDKILKKASMETFEEGGDPTINPVISINDSPTSPVNGTDSFFVGSDKHSLTREYGFWLNNRYLKVQMPQIKGLRSWNNDMVNPWKTNVPMRGTDAGQFQPLMDNHEDIWLFISDIMMPLKFVYDKDTTVSGMSAWKYKSEDTIVNNATETSEKDTFYQYLHGTLNLTSVLGAPLFATKGRFLDIGYNADYCSEIYDKTGKTLEADRNRDDVFMTVEPWTGLSLAGGQRLALNFKLDKDELFDHTQHSYLLPYAYVRREFEFNESQVNDLLGDLKFALAFCLGIQITGYVLGSLLFIGGVLLIIWAFRIRKYEGLGDYSTSEPLDNDSVIEKKPMLNGTRFSNEETKDENSAL